MERIKEDNEVYMIRYMPGSKEYEIVNKETGIIEAESRQLPMAYTLMDELTSLMTNLDKYRIGVANALNTQKGSKV